MIGREFNFHNGGKGSALAVRIKPGSRKQGFKKVLKDGTVVLSLLGTGERLNEELLDYLSTALKISRNRFQIIAGETGKDKLISILDLDPETVQQAILALID